jgi:general secretion pathway protein H
MTKQAGFTLIELMVVLVIIGIASAAVSLSLPTDRMQPLRNDAKRLALLLATASSEAQLQGSGILWLADSEGYRFIRQHPVANTPRDFSDDEQLRPRSWSSSAVKVHIAPGTQVQLNAEWIRQPQRITLSNEFGSVQLLLGATGRIEVQ